MSSATVLRQAAATGLACAHCGLPVRGAAVPRSSAGQDATGPVFCCPGCRGAYELIRGWGLEEYYELRLSTGDEVREEAQERLADLDDPRLLGRSAPLAMEAGSQQLLKSTLAISGLHCAACVWLIERACEHVPGWHSALVQMRSRTVEVVFDPRLIRLSEIACYLQRIGYRVSPLADATAIVPDNDEARALLVEIAVAGFCAANAMWVAIALYAGQFTGMAPAHAQFLRFAGVGLGLAAAVFPGRIFFRSALASIRTRTPHMDLPVAVGLAAGSAASLHALADPAREVYFDSIAMLVFFLLTGRWLQLRGQHRADEAVAELVRASPAVATRVEQDGKMRRVSVEDLNIGDLVLVQPSESVPVDGLVVAGQSLVDRSLLTGESCPVEVTVGSLVEAGTDNTQSALTISVTALGEETRLAGIKRSVVEAAETRTPVVQLANRMGVRFVVVVLVLAMVTAALWWQIDPARCVSNVVALLIVACPCALALATPLAIAVSIGRLARQQVLVRAGDCLERLASPGTICFDKTGTLTEGRMSVTDWDGSDEVLAHIAAIERDINHPVARGILAHAEQRLGGVRAAVMAASGVEHQLGCGASGLVDRHRYQIGSLRLLDREPLAIDHRQQQQLDRIVASGSSPLVVIRDGTCVAVLGVVDQLRRDAIDVIGQIRAQGWQVKLLSGDHQLAVDRAAQALGIAPEHARGDLLPEEKLAAIRSARPGPVLMVGDGVNDAAALAAADVGIAVRGGARASLAAAPVVVTSGDLQGVLDLIRTARQTRRTLGRNFAISLGYNLLAVALAMSGLITPLIAAALMPISSLTVLGLTLATPQTNQSVRCPVVRETVP